MYTCVCVYTHNGILLIKNNEIMTFTTTWVDLEIIILSERGRRKTTHDIAYMRNLKKMIQINLFIKQKQTHRLRK